MAMITNAQRITLLTRLLNKAHQNQIDPNQLVSDLVTALGTNFDTRLVTEAQDLLASLNLELTNTNAQVANVQAAITAITPATI